MKKRLIALLLVLVTMLGMLPGTALAADTEEEALGEVDIFNGGYEMYYLSMNGRVRKQSYTYFNYVDSKGETKEIPASVIQPRRESRRLFLRVRASSILLRRKAAIPRSWASLQMGIPRAVFPNSSWRTNIKHSMRPRWHFGVT